MASADAHLVQCYNKGCGQKYDPKENKEDSCCFHPGNPFFHDAYKGWSCCNKRSVDFTEFLNIKGCTINFHSNEKPPELPKPVVEKPKEDEVYEYKAPEPQTVDRPRSDAPLTTIKPVVSDALKTQIESLTVKQATSEIEGEIPIGTSCKNFGCNVTYEGPTTKLECVHHSGAPVFHEGLKYWSCCNKKNTDFSTFLNQVGCKSGDHVWIKSSSTESNCRYEWHQTGSHVYLSVYAKKYDPVKSTIQLNPVRAKIHIQFPVDNTQFNLDLELYGVIDVENSVASMLPTKVELRLKKAQPLSWLGLMLPASVGANDGGKGEKPSLEEPAKGSEAPATAQNDVVDLDFA